VIDAISFFFKKKYINPILKFAKLINFTVFLLLGWWAVISYDGVISLKKKKKKSFLFFFEKREKKKQKQNKISHGCQLTQQVRIFFFFFFVIVRTRDL
jgi:hypothetical protein